MRKLKLFMAACALMGASTTQAQSWTAGAEPAAGEYYLYNVGGDRYITNGSSWKTHSILDGQGTVLTVTVQDGKYRLRSGVSGGAGPYIWGDWMNNDAETSTNGWYFNKVSYPGYENVYTLQANDDKGAFLYWSGGGDGAWGNEVYGSGESVNDAAPQNYYWMLIPKATRQDFTSATVDTPLDVTYLLNDPDFEKRVSNDNNSSPKAGSGQTSEGWTCGGFWRQYSKQAFANGIFFEKYSGQGLTTADAIKQEPELQAGLYELSATAFASCTEFYLYAGEAETKVGESGTYRVIFQVADDATKVEMGAKIKDGGTGNWVAFDNVRLKYFGSTATIEDVQLQSLISAYNAAKNAAKAVDQTKPMENKAKEDLNAVIAQYEDVAKTEAALNEAIAALNTAVNTANASITAYSSLKNAFAIIDKELEATNVYDADAYASIKAAYNDATLTTAEAQALTGDRYTSIYSKLFSYSWQIGEKAASETGSGFYMNNWSIEGNSDGTGMTTPFYEYWTGSENALAPTTLTKTISGLEANATYNVSLLVRVQQQKDQTKADDDATLRLNGGDAINMADGAAANNAGYFYKTVNTAAVADAEGKIVLSITIKEGNHISWLSFKNLMYSNDISALVEQFAQLKTQAETLISNNPQVTGSEFSALNDAINAAPTDFNTYGAAITALETAINTFSAAIPSYNAFAAEKTYAQSLGMTNFPGEPTSAAGATEAINALKVAEYEYVTATFVDDITSSMIPSWDRNNVDMAKGEHWSGNAETQYFDKWSGSATTCAVSKTITLPEGHYVFYGSARGATSVTTASFGVKIGEETIAVPFVIKGNEGRGIATDGKANFADGGTYAKEGKGFGWEWRYVKFDLSEETEVTLNLTWNLVGNSWVSAGNLKLATYGNSAIVGKMVAGEVANAEALKGVNVGSNAFQIPTSAVAALDAAIAAANSASSVADAQTAIDNLKTAENDFKNTELNAPAEGQLFNIILTYGGYEFDNKAMTYLANDRADHGLYNIQYKAEANTNLAQAFTFTKVEGNNYKLSQIDADGNARYMSTGVPYGGNTSQIRTTTNADDAMLVTVIPTQKEGVYNLRNVAANNYIGSQDKGVFTVNSHIDFKLVETQKPSIAVSTTDFGTIMLPFAQTIPSGVKAYSCAALDGNTLTLEAVSALEANKPYIIEGAWSETLTGDAQGKDLTATDGLLTGVYANQTVAVGKYVMQNLAAGTGFYQVAEGRQPTVTANHAYLSAPAASARVLTLGGEATAIKAVEALTGGDAQIFNASGAQLPALQKGVNIIKAGGKSFKVVVK